MTGLAISTTVYGAALADPGAITRTARRGPAATLIETAIVVRVFVSTRTAAGPRARVRGSRATYTKFGPTMSGTTVTLLPDCSKTSLLAGSKSEPWIE